MALLGGRNLGELVNTTVACKGAPSGGRSWKLGELGCCVTSSKKEEAAVAHLHSIREQFRNDLEIKSLSFILVVTISEID